MATGAAINSDTATPAIRQIVVRASGRPAHAAMASSVAELIRGHLVEKDQTPNKLGGQRTHFYAAAARQTFWSASTNEAEVTVAKDGIRQRLLGGTIRPVNRKLLTIPVHAEAYGRRAGEFGSELRLVPINGGQDGKTFGFLVRGAGAVAPIFFVLKSSVPQAPDPTVLPTDEEMRAEAISGLREIIDEP